MDLSINLNKYIQFMAQQNNENSNIKNEYEGLKNYFQDLVKTTTYFLGFISVLAAGFFIYDREKLEDRVNKLEEDYKIALEQIKVKADLEIENVKLDIREKINQEIENELHSQLNKKNVNLIIDKQLNYLLDSEFSFELKRKLKTFLIETNESLNELTDISDSAIFMRIGNKKGYTNLFHYINNAKFSENRARAEELLQNISNDYYLLFSKKTDQELKQSCNCMEVDKENPKIDELVNVINQDDNLNNISTAIEILNRKFDTNFQPFEFELINKWSKNQKNK